MAYVRSTLLMLLILCSILYNDAVRVLQTDVTSSLVEFDNITSHTHSRGERQENFLARHSACFDFGRPLNQENGKRAFFIIDARDSSYQVIEEVRGKKERRAMRAVGRGERSEQQELCLPIRAGKKLCC